jgi:hypothetical protein
MLVQTSVIFVIACLGSFRACRKRCHFQSRVRWFWVNRFFRMWIRPLVLHGCCAFGFPTGFVLFGRNAEWWIHFWRLASLLSFCRDLFLGETVNCLNAIYPCRKGTMSCYYVCLYLGIAVICGWYPSVWKGSHVVVVFEQISTICGWYLFIRGINCVGVFEMYRKWCYLFKCFYLTICVVKWFKRCVTFVSLAILACFMLGHCFEAGQ